MQLLHAYKNYINQHDYEEDARQEAAVRELQRIADELAAQPAKRHIRWVPLIGRLMARPVRGAYLWGGVGRGKTFIMDMFYDYVPVQDKIRLHFHHFMRQVHADLNNISGKKNALQRVADDWAGRYRLICFDEFYVEDVADAMILGGLFQYLFERGMTLVATSNVAPDDLYAGGLQRESFLPAIAALKANVSVIHLDGGEDYRWRELIQNQRYFYPLKTGNTRLQKLFALISGGEYLSNTELLLEGRYIKAYAAAGNCVWFDFEVLCGHGRGTSDYIEIAARYRTVMISNLGVLDETREEQARRFIALIDELYEARTITLISATVPMQELYQGRRLAFAFQRTLSRLKEMQTEAYHAE